MPEDSPQSASLFGAFILPLASALLSLQALAEIVMVLSGAAPGETEGEPNGGEAA